MSKLKQIQFKCQNKKCKNIFKTNEWFAYVSKPEVLEPSCIRVQTSCPLCSTECIIYYQLDQIFYMLMEE